MDKLKMETMDMIEANIEKQFNRRGELNGELNNLKDELGAYVW